TAQLPDASFVRDAVMSREGIDLILDGPNGTVVIEGYFAADPAPNLVAPDGVTLTPHLVDSFIKSGAEYAANTTATDESPVGTVQEVSGEATVTHADGSVETIQIGTLIFQGDIIETDADGAVNIVFVDETSFAVSEDARLAIDEYVFDPATQSGESNFSVLKGVFVFTSGLIGRDDPDDVQIDTPVGSIGIRGTIIAGDVNAGEITVVEGAIVLRDFHGHEMTLATQFETARFESGGSIQNLGQMSAAEVSGRFAGVAHVSPGLFSSINDAAAEQNPQSGGRQGQSDGDTSNGSAPHSQNESDAGSTQGHTAPLQADQITTPVVAPQITTIPIAPTTSLSVASSFLTPTSLSTSMGLSQSAPIGSANSFLSTAINTTPIYQAPVVASPLVTAPVVIVNPGPAYAPPPVIPPFSVNITSYNVSEANAGAVLAIVKGNIGSAGDILLDYPFNLHLKVMATAAADEFAIMLKSGDHLNYDFLKAQNLLDAQDNLAITFQVTGPQSEILQQSASIHVTGVAEAPQHNYNAPGQFFTGDEGGVWSYNFDKDFYDKDYGGTLTFSLDTTTINNLNNLRDSGTILDSWSFDNSNGLLTLDFLNSFATTNGTYLGFDLHVQASDGAYDTGYKTYGFTAYNPHSTYENIAGAVDNATGKIMDATSGDDFIFLGQSGASNSNVIFLGDGNDQMIVNMAQNNTIYLGEGENNAVISSGALASLNTLIGGSSSDEFFIQNVKNKIFGMDGDDDFTLDLSSPLVLNPGAGLYLPNEASILIDGGHSNFRAADTLRTLDPYYEGGGGTNGRGDSLILGGSGAADIDFTRINNDYIKGIERLDAQTNGYANKITLNYTDVLGMTDGRDTLIINLGANDTLSFIDDTSIAGDERLNFHKTGTVTLDDARQGAGTPDMKAYDVYTDGEVTLLVHNEAGGATVTGLPA
ncbi:MAG: FecR family protein, partial [Alphaproteobacteria bacterium]|nr:FecR family protein [Alphaproteobacteria bacterium]